jgi:hypothetical protein
VKIDCLAKLVYLILGKMYEMDKNISNIPLKIGMLNLKQLGNEVRIFFDIFATEVVLFGKIRLKMRLRILNFDLSENIKYKHNAV